MVAFQTPTLEQLRAQPALSVGIQIFTVVFFILYPKGSDALVLKPSTPLHLDLNTLSFYIFPHLDIFHLVVNLVALYPLLSRYERAHGTVYTGITLNVLAVVTALQYCLVGLVLYPNEGAAGLLGIVFSLLMFFCYKEHFAFPVCYTFKVGGSEYLIPTLGFPFLNLIAVAIIVPQASFFGHLAGISAGYLLATDRLKLLFPALKIVLWIEKKLAPVISRLQLLVTYYKEEDAVNERGVTYRPIFTSDPELGESPLLFEPFERVLGQAPAGTAPAN